MAREKWATMVILKETLNRLKEIADRLHMAPHAVVARLLDIYEGKLNELPPVTTTPPTPEATPMERVVEDLLYIIEPVVTALLEIVRVYPDLRAEAGVVVGMAYERFCEVAQAWGMMERPPHEEEGSGEGQVPA